MVKKLADQMVAYGAESGKKNFDRDGKSVAQSEAVVGHDGIIRVDGRTNGLNHIAHRFVRFYYICKNWYQR